jgi:hypothetical protein
VRFGTKIIPRPHFTTLTRLGKIFSQLSWSVAMTAPPTTKHSYFSNSDAAGLCIRVVLWVAITGGLGWALGYGLVQYFLVK